MRITIVLALTAWIFLSSCSPVYAQNTDIGASLIHPAHPLYFLKAIRENLEIHFAQTPRVKMVRQLEFATRRLRELNSLIDKDRQDLIEPNLERYWSHMNTVLKFRPRAEELTLLLNHTISTHLNVLEELYQNLDDKRAKMSIRSAIYRILNSSDITGEPRLKGCEFLSKEASSSALTEVEREILKGRLQNCLRL